MSAPFDRELDTDAIDRRRERTRVYTKERLIDILASADIEVKRSFLRRDIQKDGQETQPPFLKNDRYFVPAFDQAFDMKNYFVQVSERAALDILLGIVIFSIGVVHVGDALSGAWRLELTSCLP